MVCVRCNKEVITLQPELVLTDLCEDCLNECINFLLAQAFKPESTEDGGASEMLIIQ